MTTQTAESLSKQFKPPRPLMPGDSQRYLMREEILIRQAKSTHHKKLRRKLLLFNDILIVAEVKHPGKRDGMILKQTFYLDDEQTKLEVNVNGFTKMPHSFGISYLNGREIFGCETKKDKKAWIKAIKRSMKDSRQFKKESKKNNGNISERIHLNFPSNSDESVNKINPPILKNSGDYKYSNESDKLMENKYLQQDRKHEIDIISDRRSSERVKQFDKKPKSPRRNNLTSFRERGTLQKQRAALMGPADTCLEKVNSMTKELINIASENLSSQLKTVESAEETTKKAIQLEKNAVHFKRSCRVKKKNAIWQSRRNVWLIIGIISIVILLIIIIIMGSGF